MIQQDDDEEKGSFGATRYPCMPSLVAMQQMKNRLNLAFLGKKLMKWSAMATGRELRKISSEMHGVYGDYHADSCNGYILLARARYFLPHLNSIVVENVARHAQVSLSSSIKTISGVRVVQYGIEDTEKDPYEHLGIERGGQVIKEAKRAWNDLIKRMIMILELRTSFILVEQANRSATKKFNVLGKMVIPRIIMTLKYILAELEENEREENFRLKRFKQLKIKRKSEEVVVCRCCFSNFAAGEVMGGDMCPLCRQNVHMKSKVDKTAPHVKCVKEMEHLEQACHLDNEIIHFSFEDDGDIIQWQSNEDRKPDYEEDIVLKWLSIEDKIIDEDLNATLLQSEENNRINKEEKATYFIDDTFDKKTDELKDKIEKDELKDILECSKCGFIQRDEPKDVFKNPDKDILQKDEPKEVLQYPKYDFSMCSQIQKTRMYSYILSVLSSVYDEINEKQEFNAPHTSPFIRKLLRMPAYLPYEGVDIEKTHVPKVLRMPKNIIPVYIDNCKNFAPQIFRAKKLKMPLDLAPTFIPCEECKLSLLPTKPNKTPCGKANCEKCRPEIHMPLDLPILSCNKCSSKPHILMPLDLPIHISPCRSLCQKCMSKNADLSSVMSDLYKPEPNSSLPYDVPRETLVCHSWTFKRLLRMPRSLSSGTSHDQSTSDQPKTSRCSCTPNMHTMIPENHALNTYIHQLCQLQPNREHIRMPLNLLTESQPDLNRCETCITKEASTCSRSLTDLDDTCIITTSDENKLFEDCAIHGPGCCDSTCSLSLDEPDFEKIVKVETKKKRKPDGTFREEKVTTKRYVVKTMVKPPDICSCSRFDVVGEDSRSYGHNEEGDAGKADTQMGTESRSKQDYHDLSNKNKTDKKEVDNNSDKSKPQIICKCHDKEALMSCECFKVATSESNDNENIEADERVIGNSKKLPDLVCCKNNACLTQNLMNLLSSYQLANKNLAADDSASKPCHSIVIKSADNETMVCSGTTSKEKSIRTGLNMSSSQKEVEVVPPHSRFFKLKDVKSGTCPSCPISVGPEITSSLSPKWCNPSSSAKSIAQLDHSSTISRIVKLYLNKNNHKSTSCTDLLVVKQCLERSQELTKPLKISKICDEKNQCPVKNCPFHSSKHEICLMSSDIKSQKACAQTEPQNAPTTSQSDKQAHDTATNTDINLSLSNVKLKIKEEVIKVSRATSTVDQSLYSKQERQAESQKSSCPIPSTLGWPSTPRPIIVTPKSSLSQYIYPTKYNSDNNVKKDAGTQMTVPICDREVDPCNAAINKSASVSSRSSSRHKRGGSKKKKDKCVIKIKVKEKIMKPMTENKDFCIEGQMADGSNVVIVRRSKSNFSKSNKQDEFDEKICKKCLAKLRGDKPINRPNCHKNHEQEEKKCKYCDLLADFSVSADPSSNSIAERSDSHCCQTSNTSCKSSTLSSISTPGDELCIKVSSSNPSTKTHPIPVSGTPSGAQFKVCEKASKLRGYASECAFHKPLKPCGRPRTCTSVSKMRPKGSYACTKGSDACTSTKNLNRYDVRSICDEPRSRRKTKCTPKASNVKCRSTSVQCHLIKSDTALDKRRLRTRPHPCTSFYEVDCQYFKPPCGCPY